MRCYPYISLMQVFRLFLVFLVVLMTSSSAMAVLSLEELLDGRVTLEEVVSSGLKVQDLVVQFRNRKDLKASEINQVLSKKGNLVKLKQFIALEKEMIRQLKRADRGPKKNKQFYGNANLAVDAGLIEMEFYSKVKAQLEGFLASEAIHESTYRVSMNLIDDLEFLHSHNQQISREFSESSHSATYQGRTHIHFEMRDLEFQYRAGALFLILQSAFEFASEYEILPELFTDGLRKSNGCLEDSFRSLSRWHELRIHHLESLKDLSLEERNSQLADTGENLVYGYIEKKHAELSEKVSNSSLRLNVVQQIHDHFIHKTDCNSLPITEDVIRGALRNVFCLTPSPKRRSENVGTDSEKVGFDVEAQLKVEKVL